MSKKKTLQKLKHDLKILNCSDRSVLGRHTRGLEPGGRTVCDYIYLFTTVLRLGYFFHRVGGRGGEYVGYYSGGYFFSMKRNSRYNLKLRSD